MNENLINKLKAYLDETLHNGELVHAVFTVNPVFETDDPKIIREARASIDRVQDFTNFYLDDVLNETKEEKK